MPCEARPAITPGGIVGRGARTASVSGRSTVRFRPIRGRPRRQGGNRERVAGADRWPWRAVRRWQWMGGQRRVAGCLRGDRSARRSLLADRSPESQTAPGPRRGTGVASLRAAGSVPPTARLVELSPYPTSRVGATGFIGYSPSAGEMIVVIAYRYLDGDLHGMNAWPAGGRDLVTSMANARRLQHLRVPGAQGLASSAARHRQLFPEAGDEQHVLVHPASGAAEASIVSAPISLRRAVARRVISLGRGPGSWVVVIMFSRPARP